MAVVTPTAIPRSGGAIQQPLPVLAAAPRRAVAAGRRQPEHDGERPGQLRQQLQVVPSCRRDCHSAAPLFPISRRFNTDGEGMSAK